MPKRKAKREQIANMWLFANLPRESKSTIDSDRMHVREIEKAKKKCVSVCAHFGWMLSGDIESIYIVIVITYCVMYTPSGPWLGQIILNNNNWAEQSRHKNFACQSRNMIRSKLVANFSWTLQPQTQTQTNTNMCGRAQHGARTHTRRHTRAQWTFEYITYTHRMILLV